MAESTDNKLMSSCCSINVSALLQRFLVQWETAIPDNAPLQLFYSVSTHNFSIAYKKKRKAQQLLR